MEAQSQQKAERRKLPVYTEDAGRAKQQSQQKDSRIFKIFKQGYSESRSTKNPRCSSQQQQLQKLQKISIPIENNRKLHFYQPQRIAEGWVRRNERFAEQQRSKRRTETINNKRQMQTLNIKLKICLQNVRKLNSKLKQDQIVREIEDKNPDFIALVETRLQRIIGLNSQNITQTHLARNGGVFTMNSGKYQIKIIKTLKQFWHGIFQMQKDTHYTLSQCTYHRKQMMKQKNFRTE
ncbi:hypothetical protein OXYTRIMIC_048 [Oxytricha trifallax]|uniref:Uncharacterized protein n=1 Tax=Oxytricha trifallax TaxID=1172189 RepID=A0A073I0T2_9SPIT|nr:hypothetical protein OXYTRIMIC_048 [Oxytricha trifallax]